MGNEIVEVQDTPQAIKRRVISPELRNVNYRNNASHSPLREARERLRSQSQENETLLSQEQLADQAEQLALQAEEYARSAREFANSLRAQLPVAASTGETVDLDEQAAAAETLMDQAEARGARPGVLERIRGMIGAGVRMLRNTLDRFWNKSKAPWDEDPNAPDANALRNVRNGEAPRRRGGAGFIALGLAAVAAAGLAFASGRNNEAPAQAPENPNPARETVMGNVTEDTLNPMDGSNVTGTAENIDQGGAVEKENDFEDEGLEGGSNIWKTYSQRLARLDPSMDPQERDALAGALARVSQGRMGIDDQEARQLPVGERISYLNLEQPGVLDRLKAAYADPDMRSRMGLELPRTSNPRLRVDQNQQLLDWALYGIAK